MTFKHTAKSPRSYCACAASSFAMRPFPELPGSSVALLTRGIRSFGWHALTGATGTCEYASTVEVGESSFFPPMTTTDPDMSTADPCAPREWFMESVTDHVPLAGLNISHVGVVPRVVDDPAASSNPELSVVSENLALA